MSQPYLSKFKLSNEQQAAAEVTPSQQSTTAGVSTLWRWTKQFFIEEEPKSSLLAVNKYSECVIDWNLLTEKSEKQFRLQNLELRITQCWWTNSGAILSDYSETFAKVSNSKKKMWSPTHVQVLGENDRNWESETKLFVSAISAIALHYSNEFTFTWCNFSDWVLSYVPSSSSSFLDVNQPPNVTFLQSNVPRASTWREKMVKYTLILFWSFSHVVKSHIDHDFDL